MKTTTTVLAIVILGAVGAGSYWLGQRAQAPAHSGAAATAGSAEAPKARKLLYYRNPMGLADTSPTPKKDPMGMDYIAVYEGEDESGGSGAAASPNQIRISTEKVQKLGVRTEAAAMRPLGKTVRVAGRVEPDERRVYVIAPKFEGYVEKLHVNATGQPVGQGQPLFEAYSPELVAAQREYAIAVQGLQAMAEAGSDAQSSMKQLAAASLTRLRNWDLSTQQVEALVKTGQPSRTLTFRSPVAGIVTEKKALQGMRFMPGEMLYQVTDLSSVWVVADVFEQDIAAVKVGSQASITVNAYPEQVFAGRISYVYPTMNAQTRTVPVRIELANPRHLLKPAMFAQLELPVGSALPVLTVPESAVIDSGTRRIVLVQVQEGRFEPREIESGRRSDSHIEVRKGLREGEQVVVSANFLIDAESNLRAAIGGLVAPAGQAPAAAGSAPASTSAPAPAPAKAVVGHRAEGRVEGIDAKAGTLSLQHGPVASLKWPAMTMEFKLANATLLQGLAAGQRVSFEFVERQAGEYVVTAIAAVPTPAAPASPASAAKNPPSGR